MFAAIMLAAGLAAPAEPAPLPNRWLLKLVPEKLPPLSDRFYDTTWYATNAPLPRFGHPWELWAGFHKAGKDRPAEAVVTLPEGRQNLGAGFGGLLFTGPTTPGHRTVPLAVDGPLVEFERKLYTATIRTRKAIHGKQTEGEVLYLGSAIEVKKDVWYQAGTSIEANGNRVMVEEWRIDFRDDPRTNDRGKARLRGHWRVITELKGESFDEEVGFHSGKTYEGGRTAYLHWPSGMRQTPRLPQLEFEDVWGRPSVMRLDGMHTLTLEPATKPAPKLPEQYGLVQPPAKKAGK